MRLKESGDVIFRKNIFIENEEMWADEIIETFISIYPELKETIMQAAIQLEKRGEARGMQQGIQERNWEIAKTMIFSNEPKEKIHQFTGLGWGEIEKLRHDQK